MNNENNNLNNQPIQPNTNPVNNSNNNADNTTSVPVQPSVVPTNQVSGSDVKVEGPRINTAASQSNINAAAFNMQNREKKVNEASNNRPKGLSVALVIFLIALIAYVIFLPEINNLIANYKNRIVKEEINTGQLRCTLVDRTSNFTITYNRNFKFTDNKITSYNFTTETKGSASKDEDELTALYNDCMKLDQFINGNGVDGAEISCENIDGTVTKSESVDLVNVNFDDFKTYYSEAGGTLPVDVSEGDNVDNVMRDMQAEKFTCEKIK